eukprot:183492_1
MAEQPESKHADVKELSHDELKAKHKETTDKVHAAICALLPESAVNYSDSSKMLKSTDGYKYSVYCKVGAGYVLGAKVHYYTADSKEHTDKGSADIGGSVSFDLPKGSTNITATAWAKAGSNIFKKHYALVTDTAFCNSFICWGTTLIHDYENLSGHDKHCHDTK